MSDLDKKYPLRLDTRIDFKNLIPHFYVSDNETSDFYIKFTNDNQPVSVENVVIAIVVVNPNSQINSSLLDVNIDKGLIYCNLPNELKNVVGVYKAKIMCISEEERLVSNTFEYKVDMDEFAILNEVVENSDEILLLTQMLSQINVISTEEGKRIENENIRLVNETERTTNETNRINNEDERKSNELERIANETKRNNDENERQLKEAERNENELNRESQELIRQNNEVDRTAYDEVLSNNEEERIANESDRIAHEESRANSENIRINNENNRERNEQIRQNNEEDRKFEFTMMNQSLNDLALGVNSVKNDILNSESNRVSSEDERKSNEELRIDNEDVRITNEEARVKNEDTRLKSEEIRVSNEDTRERSENARKTNETTRVSNENKRITAESTRSNNENIRVNAENRRRNEHTARMEEIDEALANLPNSLPVANQTTLGGIKVGAGLSITADGILSATGGGSGDGLNTISSNLILSLTASEIQNSIDSGTEITLSSLDGIFDENKRYIVEFLGERKLSSIYPTNNEVIHWNIACNFGDYLVDLYYSASDNVMKLGIVKKNTDTVVTATDLKVYEEIVTPFDDKYLPMNLTMQNSISMGRIGEIGMYSVAFGFCTEASGTYSFSQGRKTTASGDYSHAEGYDATASGVVSHTEGIGTTASGNASHAEGYGTKASNYYSHSEGCGATASGIISHAEGIGTTASGGYSHAEGYYTTASSSNQHVQGKYNIEDTENKYAHIVGNGTSDTARSNAHTLDWNGNGWYKGKLSQDGTPTEDKDLTTKRYVDGKVAEIVNSAPETLDTLNELATALGNDPNFATTVSTQIGNKVDKVTGKGLSTNDLTDALKSNYDTAYTHSQSAHFSGSYNDLTDKPTIPTSLPANGGNADTVGGYTIWTGTQTEYNALGTYSDTTIYMIKEG